MIKSKKIWINYIYITILLIVLISSKEGFAQKFNKQEVRDSLKYYFKQIGTENSDSNKILINRDIQRIIRNALSFNESFDSPLDSVLNLGVVISENNRVRFYTWNIPFNDGTHKYFGFIHYYSKKDKKYNLFELFDNSDNIKKPTMEFLSSRNWFGGLLYMIIEKKYKGDTYYILLYSDLNDLHTKKKIIDVLQFGEHDLPVFGARIFKDQPQNTRIIFEFNARASMTLTYDNKLKMIVFDHLSPSKPSLKGVYEFYGPDFSYDGYKFEKGFWVLHPDIDIRNNK
ncbi:MAG: hypothetical protein AB7S50_00790 [Bacteroidales bacterium]